MEERLAIMDEKIKILEDQKRAEKEKVKKFEMEAKLKNDKFTKKENEIYGQCNTVIVNLCRSIQKSYLIGDQKFAAFVDTLEKSGNPINFR